MSLFDRFFRKSHASDPLSDIMLRLEYPATPEYAAKHAQIVVEKAERISGGHLDYSPGSIAHVDQIIGEFHAQGLRRDQIAETIFRFGCYVGEIMVRHHKGTWKMPADTSMPDELKKDKDLMVVELPNGNIWNPIGKAFKLLAFGE